MGIPNILPFDGLIAEALRQPLSAVAYFVTHRLRELYPNYGFLETDDSDFQLEAFANDGLCELAPHPNVLNINSARWVRDSGTIYPVLETGVFEVAWKGQWLLVLRVTWSNNGCNQGKMWLLGPDQDVVNGFFAEVCQHSIEVEEEILVFQDGYWSKDDHLFQAIQSATFDNLILSGSLKEEVLTDAAQFFSARELYDRFAIPWKRGIILIGPPGNGKTHTVKALVNALKKPCLYVKSVVSQYDQPHHNIRVAFEKARQMAPCVFVLEDLDALITDESRSFFLNEVDGFAANTGILIVATTNHPERIDPAILNRPSRFDRKYAFKLPDLDCRTAYIRNWNETLDPHVRLSPQGIQDTAERTEGFSFAYLKELFLSALMAWINTSRVEGLDGPILGQIDLLREQMAGVEA